MLSKLWEPARILNPIFIDAWTCKESEGSQDMVHVLLDSKCEHAVPWKPRDLNETQRRKIFVEDGEISFSRVYAKSGSGRESMASSKVESISSEDDDAD